MVRGHRVDVSALLAGSRNTVEIEDEAPIESFEGVVFEQLASVRLRLRSTNGWLEVEGSVDARASGECDVCLDPIGFDVHVDVDEHFDSQAGRDADPFGEGNVLVGSHFDVADLAQQVVLSALPMGVRCPRHEGPAEF
ncbi:MAG: YceD family protein [Candidatus Tyrphobacter sp.]